MDGVIMIPLIFPVSPGAVLDVILDIPPAVLLLGSADQLHPLSDGAGRFSKHPQLEIVFVLRLI
ncbi:MAG TPA: hypothetical protein DCZ91_08805 [Lachnospiraceae bacterium]|nr:hypothetical protein [Lachnospiraceae bacterium]